MGTDTTRLSCREGHTSKSGRLRKPVAVAWAGALLVAGGVVPTLAGDGPRPPHAADRKHLGVATCASSTCHGSAEAREASPVLRNEYLTWHRRDAHAGSYETLLEDRSQRMARRLGVGAPKDADICLDCHADNVAEARRGERFQIEDGIGCESCHGGAEEWIETHASGEASHADNIERGMYPTDRPAARARLCLDCHYSHPDARMSHRLMAAGHPRLQFELSTFSQIQPPHYRVDADYRERKRAATAAQTWAVGEVIAARKTLALIREDLYHGGTFPELYYFDCQSCHHEMEDPDWVASSAGPTGLGEVPLEVASLRIVAAMLEQLAPGLAQRWRDRLNALQGATESGPARVREAAGRLRELTGAVRDTLADESLDGERIVDVMAGLVGAGQQRGFGDRTWADLATMALASLLKTARERALLDDDRLDRLEQALDGLYATLDDPDDYAPYRYRDALRTFGERLP